MYQQESIYNLIPKEKILPGKTSLYHSKYPHWLAPTASTFILNNTSYPNIANINGDVVFPRGAHPIRENWATMVLPIGGYKQDPQNFYKKGHQFKTLPPPERIRSISEVKKPPIPTIADKPIMGLKSNKNFHLMLLIIFSCLQEKKSKKNLIMHISINILMLKL